ncbi:MAG TPA: hypothetical protein VL500_01405, partial [Candidatus Eisenbacteria bacterium]|nr:hypothetical protein [Candidatus Eisenbacteria bacterium]
MAKKRALLHRYIEILVILLVAAVLTLFRGTQQGIDETLTASAAACPILDGGTGDDDAVVNGTVTISSSKTFSAITGAYDCTATPFLITGSGTLILDTNTTTGQIAQVNFGSLTVDAGGVIQSNFKGCLASTNYIVAPNSSNVCSSDSSFISYGAGAGGAGHGGAGGNGSAVSGRGAYDSALAPTLVGAAGGSTSQAVANGGDGGGIVRITVTGTFTHNGSISVDGESGLILGANAAGGGSGGSIYVTAGTLNGAGTFSARGGNGGDSTNDGGGGGGGRIAIYHGGGSYAFDAGDFSVAGGAASGTAQAGTKGTVFVKNTATNAVSIFHGFSFDNTNHFVSSWTVDASATNQYCESTASTPAVHATGAITFAGTLNCTTSISSLTFDATTTLSFASGSSFSVNGGAYLNAGSNFSIGAGSAVSTTKTDANLEFSVPAGNAQVWDSFTVNVGAEGEFITDDAFPLTLQNGTAINASVRWTNLTSFTQNSGTSINANFKGCLAGNNYIIAPGGSNVCATDSSQAFYGSGAGGAGHGGAAGAGSTSPSRAVFDSAVAPSFFGPSGASTNQGIANGGDGGGTVRIAVSGTFTANGLISADGENGLANGTTGAGGAAGGSIYITSGSMNGTTGTFSAKGGNGGDGSSNDGGGGGGGRIAIYRAGGGYTFDAGDFTITGGTATGSATAGAKGTVYVKDTATNAVSIFHGFSFDNTNHFVSSWTTDPSATAQYCESSASTPSVHAIGNITLAGTLNCSSAITSLTMDAGGTLAVSNGTSFTVNGAISYTAGTGLTMGTGVTISNTRQDYDIEFNVGPGTSSTWDSLTVNVAAEGEFIMDDAFSLTLQNGTAINGNVRWTNLANLTQNSGTSINANSKGCLPGTNYILAPNSSNVCFSDSSQAFYGSGAGAPGHGGAGGAGSTSPSRAVYDSPTAPAFFGASGGSTNQGIANGGDGGGIVRIDVSGTFTANGSISADGENGLANGTTGAGGAAGGGIYITSGALNGTTGAFSA